LFHTSMVRVRRNSQERPSDSSTCTEISTCYTMWMNS
jgi:hypothetical protein